MKSKSLISIALIGVSCIAVSFLMVAKAHQDDFSLARAQGNEYTIVMNKDTMYSYYHYSSPSSGPSDQYAFFPMKYEGNYAVLNDYSSTTPCPWNKNGHLYYNATPNTVGGRVRIYVDLVDFRGSVMYFDSKCTQRIKCPGFAQLTKVQFTTASENQVAFNPSYYVNQVTTNVSGNTITISADNLTDYYTGVKLLDFSNQSESDYGTILAIDEIVLTYTCSNG